MKQLIISSSLIFIALIIFMIILPIGVLWQIKSYFKKKESYTFISDILFAIAQCIDQLGNVCFQELFNDILITSIGYKFGNHKETISSVIGKNFESNTLSKTGNILNKLLNMIQPNHTIISIEDNVQ